MPSTALKSRIGVRSVKRCLNTRTTSVLYMSNGLITGWLRQEVLLQGAINCSGYLRMFNKTL